ncbi:MAG: FAD/NAD(P)-binding protein [Clostridiales bacterium]|nr:FAD/NAD(P)-binding protein [Clostridiales bacterium]
MNDNPYLPLKAEIQEIIQETTSDLDVKTYRLKFAGDRKMEFMPGQFVELSVAGTGEAPFGFASNPLRNDTIDISIKRTGTLTDVIHALKEGDTVFVRGPFGNTFPVEKLEGNDILYIAGGIGLAPLRPLITYMLEDVNRSKYKKIQMLIAARSSKDFIYFREYEEWRGMKDTEVTLTIDNEEEGWNENVGFPHNLVAEMTFDMNKTYAVLCGPPIMIKFVSQKLIEMGMSLDRIYTTLEMRMTCGVGNCGKCNIGHKYVCVDGPVFNLAELGEMPDEY